MEKTTSEIRDAQVKRKNLIDIVLAIAIIVVIGVVLANQENNGGTASLVKLEENQEALSVLEKQELLEKIKKHIVLPSEDEPLIVRINNAEDLKKNQAFFTNSKDNDILIVYQDKALIYRLDEDLLINVGPVYINDAPSSQVQAIDLDIRNGSEVVGKAGILGDELGNREEYEIVNVVNANRKDYQESILVNLTNKDISVLEEELGLKAINTMPEGEADSNADVVIILGN